MESVLPPERIMQTICSGTPVLSADDLEQTFSVELELLRKETLSARPQAIKKLIRSLNSDAKTP